MEKLKIYTVRLQRERIEMILNEVDWSPLSSVAKVPPKIIFELYPT